MHVPLRQIAWTLTLIALLAPSPARSAPAAAEAPPSTGQDAAGAAETPPGTGEETKPPAAKEVKPARASQGGEGGRLPGADDVTPPGPKPWPEVMHGVGASFMYNIVPHFFLSAFTEGAKNKSYGLYQPAFGIHYVRRKKSMDMTVRVMFGFYHLEDGNWLGRGHDWSETDYTEFHNMNFLWADVTWTWHTRLAKRFYLAYGAGIGLGWVTGTVYTTKSSGCTKDNYGDARVCHPPQLINQCTKDGCPRDALKDLHEKEKSVPPVLPAITGLIGLRYDFFRHLSGRLDTGIFLPGFWYVQIGLTAMF